MIISSHRYPLTVSLIVADREHPEVSRGAPEWVRIVRGVTEGASNVLAIGRPDASFTARRLATLAVTAVSNRKITSLTT